MGPKRVCDSLAEWATRRGLLNRDRRGFSRVFLSLGESTKQKLTNTPGQFSELGEGGCTSMMRPVAQGYAFVAFGDAQVDLALAEIEKGFSLAQHRERRRPEEQV